MKTRIGIDFLDITGAQEDFNSLLPGLVLTASIAVIAIAANKLFAITALSPMILSIILGLMLQNTLGTPSGIAPGVTFSMKRLLRLGIILLGLQITLADALSLGGISVAIIAATLTISFIAIRLVGRVLGVDDALSNLIAAGTSVCGASAVIAANTVAKGSDEDVAYAISCVTVLGSASMFIYPMLASPLGLSDLAYGVWTGATVHEVAQVAGAAFQHSDAAGQYGTISKLTRVVMLAPLVLAMAAVGNIGHQGEIRGHVTMPWFVMGFVCLVLINSAIDLPRMVLDNASLVTTFLLSMALAAMGVQTDIHKLRAKGVQPLLLGVFGWLFITGFGLLMIKSAGY
ncbi:putative sulfate exporter family transporter [Hoeflea sp. G2-23]|uniref:Sulfate exporter family transporter n=1 Tax=Hoeflea algicola TaxID=2983763 RepID=A0ABT3ZEA9_9HYPH|nr:putative sulfate exporter family transporter [Hoeflea algicola]MCY0150131.1 putative sulfate exporter family transporter [Hoeflea algicola]